MLLIYPPVAKPCEPPAGIARLSGALQQHGVPHTIVDANVEGLGFLMKKSGAAGDSPPDTWTRRAVRRLARDRAVLNDFGTYRALDRYKSAVMNINRVIERAAGEQGVVVSLSDYADAALSPLKSSDLLRSAEEPGRNPFFPYFSARLTQLIEGEAPSAVGLSLTFLSQALTTFAMIGFLRDRFPELRIIIGGGLVTSWMRRPGWSDPFRGLVDACIAGPGEERLLSLLGVHVQGEAAGCRTYTPDYALLRNNGYSAPGFILPYSGSEGCSWSKCSFCPERAEGSRFSPVSSERVIDDLALLARRVSPSLIHFLDSAMSPSLLRKLAASPQPAPWYGFARVGRELADYDFCMALKASGCVMLKLGIESGDQDVLDRLRKGIEVETASQALRMLHKAGIATYVYLLFGTPAETEAAAARTLDFTVRHHAVIDFLNLAVFNMPVNAPDAAHYGAGIFYEGDLSLYTGFDHPSGWSRRRVRRFLDGEFKRHPSIAAILRREPPFFTSNHAPFFSPFHPAWR